MSEIYDGDLQDYEGNTYRMGASSLSTAEFVEASTRENIVPGETHKIIWGKIRKWFNDMKAVCFSGSYTDLSNKPTIPSGAAANYAVANNDTTTAAGYVADARIVRAHGLEIDQIISDLSALNDAGAILGLDAREDGVYITYIPAAGADPVIKKLASPVITGEIDVETSYGIKWHESGTYNVGKGYLDAFLVFTRVRDELKDCELKIDQSYDSSTGIITYSFSKDPDYDGIFITTACRQVRYFAIAF